MTTPRSRLIREKNALQAQMYQQQARTNAYDKILGFVNQYITEGEQKRQFDEQLKQRQIEQGATTEYRTKSLEQDKLRTEAQIETEKSRQGYYSRQKQFAPKYEPRYLKEDGKYYKEYYDLNSPDKPTAKWELTKDQYDKELSIKSNKFKDVYRNVDGKLLVFDGNTGEKKSEHDFGGNVKLPVNSVLEKYHKFKEIVSDPEIQEIINSSS